MGTRIQRIHPQNYQGVLKKHMICSLGMVGSQSEGRSVGPSESARKRRTKYLSERIDQYNDMAPSTNDVRKWLMNITVTHWKMGDEDMAEWHKEIRDEFREFAAFDEGEAAMASKELRDIIDSSDPLMCS